MPPLSDFAAMTYEEQAAHLRADHAAVPKQSPTTLEEQDELRRELIASHAALHEKGGRADRHQHEPVNTTVDWRAAALALAGRLGWEEAPGAITTSVENLVGFHDAALEQAYESGRVEGQRQGRLSGSVDCG